jgi:hypothetical protein
LLAGRLPPLRAQQQAIWRPPDDSSRPGRPSRGQVGTGAVEPGPPHAETAGLFAATDGLVDAVNTANEALAAWLPRYC